MKDLTFTAINPFKTFVNIFKLIFVSLLLLQSNIGFTQATYLIRDNNLNGSTTWYSGNTYILDGLVYLESGSLTIQAGAIIKGRQNPSTGHSTSALIITRGANIYANGTEYNPIIFTAESDDLNDPFDLDETDKGLWGGLAVLGYGQVGTSDSTPTPSGLSSTDPDNYYGGSNDSDYAGYLRYVSIRHAGASNLGALTLAGVGSSTDIHHIEVFASGGDGLKLYGGKANLKYLAVTYSRYDAIEWFYGWRGKGQFWLIFHDGSSSSYHAIEAHGASPNTHSIFSNPTIYNATIVGDTDENARTALKFDDASGGTFANSIITGFPNYAIEVEDLSSGIDSRQRVEQGQLNLLNNIWGFFGEGGEFNTGANGLIYISSSAPDQSATFLVNELNGNYNVSTELANTSLFPEPILMNGISETISETNNVFLQYPDPRFNSYNDVTTPSQPSVPSDPFFSYDSFYEAVLVDGYSKGCTPYGAFPNEDYWILHWTTLYEGGYIYYDDYIEFEGSLLQSGEFIDMDCIGRDSFETSFYLYSPNCEGGVDPNEGGNLAENDKIGRGGKIDPMPSLCDFNEQYEITYNLIEHIGNYDYIYKQKTIVANLVVVDYCDPIIKVKPPNFPSNLYSNSYFSIVVEDIDPNIEFLVDIDNFSTYIRYGFRATDECDNTSGWVYLRHYFGNSFISFYADCDGDGFGDPASRVQFTSSVPGYVTNNQDCDDTNPNINPDQIEINGNARDDDCDGITGSKGCSAYSLYVPNDNELFDVSALFHSEELITSDALIYQNSEVTFRSPVGILLEPGFTVSKGGVFIAEIGACNFCEGTTLLTLSSDSFSDGSGSDDYLNNSKCKWLIWPDNANSVTLHFNSFNN